uniref:G protein-coupled receptor n=1 Tax=Meloidogyne hapla TaxID=6305 RepID=A0A1I8BM92_MELHA
MCLVVNAIITGYLAIVGAVYCTYPRFIYFAGSAGLALWGCETVAEMILAVNRCIELSSRTWAEFLFHGKRTYLWMIFPTIYGLWFFIFEMPIHFSGIFVSWFFNPHVGYLDDFGKKTFVQVILISSINAIAAAIYVYMQFARISEVLILTGQFTWMLAHGMPPVIYLALNKTVRRDVYRMCVGVFPCVKQPLNSSVASVAGLPPSNTRNRIGPSSTVGPSIH